MRGPILPHMLDWAGHPECDIHFSHFPPQLGDHQQYWHGIVLTKCNYISQKPSCNEFHSLNINQQKKNDIWGCLFQTFSHEMNRSQHELNQQLLCLLRKHLSPRTTKYQQWNLYEIWNCPQRKKQNKFERILILLTHLLRNETLKWWMNLSLNYRP